MKTIYDIKLKDEFPSGSPTQFDEDLLPDNLAKDRTVSAAADAIDPQLKSVSDLVDVPSLYADLAKLSSRALDHLAMQYDVSVWRDNWAIEAKRSVLANAIRDKRKKGTRGAVRKALASLGSSAMIIEWFNETPPAAVHTFRIVATQSDIPGATNEETLEDIRALIDDAKPLRSHYTLSIQEALNGSFEACGVLRACTVRKVKSMGVDRTNASGAVGLVGAARTISRRNLISRA